MVNVVTGGVVSIEDGKKAAEEYAPARKVRVELHFSVPEGCDSEEFLDYTAEVADALVQELLGRQPPRVAAKNTEKSASGVPQQAALVENKTQVISKSMLLDAFAPEVPVEKPVTPLALDNTPPSPAFVYNAVAQTQALIKNAKAITALVKKHTADNPPEKQTVGGIPEANRVAFLADLEALKGKSQ
jgi:hypothetical protein